MAPTVPRPNPDPCQCFMTDLGKFWTKICDDGADYILGWAHHHNEIQDFLQDHDMVDTFSNFMDEHPVTHSSGSAQINLISMSCQLAPSINKAYIIAPSNWYQFQLQQSHLKHQPFWHQPKPHAEWHLHFHRYQSHDTILWTSPDKEWCPQCYKLDQATVWLMQMNWMMHWQWPMTIPSHLPSPICTYKTSQAGKQESWATHLTNACSSWKNGPIHQWRIQPM